MVRAIYVGTAVLSVVIAISALWLGAKVDTLIRLADVATDQIIFIEGYAKDTADHTRLSAFYLEHGIDVTVRR